MSARNGIDVEGVKRSSAPGARWPRRVLLSTAALWVIDVGGAYALDALGLVESLLSPSDWRALAVLPMALVFFMARLLLFFVAPGLALGALLLGWVWPPPRDVDLPRRP